MFEQTKALCQHFLDMGIPCFDLIVYKDGKCVFRHMGGYSNPEKKIRLPFDQADETPDLTY